MKKWEYKIISKAKWGYDIDYETKRIAHLILEREGKLLKKQLDALERKEMALAEELARIRRAECWINYKIKACGNIDEDL